MIISRMKFATALLASLAVMAPVWGQTKEEQQLIQKAVPGKPTVKPQKKRKVLVYSQTLGYKHTSVPYGEEALRVMAKKTGAFDVDFSVDPAVFTAENLAKYDAVLFNNTTGEILTTPEQRNSLLEFVRGGGGVVGFHAATDTNFTWQEYGEMMGGYFDNHPWRASDTVTIKLDEPDHPLNAAFEGKSFEINDEIYQFREPYSREKVLVLSSLDVEKTDMTKEGVKRTDNDFAISWVRQYGNGRVFYSSLGHNHHIFWNEAVLQHFLDGIQFALGDLEAPSNPNAAGAGAAEVSDDEIKAAVAAFEKYDYGEDRAFVLVIDQAIRQTVNKEERRNRLANALAAEATNADRTFAARDIALRKLGEMGAGAQAEKIEDLLADKDPKIAERARQTIEAIPGDKADKALLKALDKVSGNVKIGIIHSLGNRQVNAAVKPLTAIARSNDVPQAQAAMLSLGNIANDAAGQALLDDIRPPDAAREAWFAAMNDAAATIGKKNTKLSERLFNRVLQLGEKSPARLAAFKGLAVLQDQTEAAALKALDGKDADLQEVARELLVQGTNKSITSQLKNRLANSEGEQQVVFIEILAARRDKDALAEITALAEKAESAPVQVAALRALEHLGDEKSVPLLLKVAAGRGEVAAAARATLEEMNVAEVDAELVRLIGQAESPEERVVAIEAAVTRKSPGAIDAVMGVTKDSNAKVLTAAFRAAATLATADHLPGLLDAQSKLNQERLLREAGRAIVAAARKGKRPQAVEKIVASYKAAQNDDQRFALLGALGSLGGGEALAFIKSNLDSDNEKVRDGAIRALADFPDASALDDLMALSSHNETTQVHKVLALRGVVRLLSQPSDKSAEERLAMGRKALELAEGAEEKKAVIGALADMTVPGVLPLVLPYLDDEELKKESAAAVLRHAPVAAAFDWKGTAVLLNPLSKKLDHEQWNKLEEILTPSPANCSIIRAWHVSEVFKADDDSNLTGLMEKELAPETDAYTWKDALYGSTNEEKPEEAGKLDLGQRYPGSRQTAIYLKAHIFSPDEREARLDSGSDDGLRVWLNGERVFTHDSTRSFSWWKDKTDVTLKRGWNTVLLKVGQGGGGWEAAARIVDRDGKPMEDINISATLADQAE